jgi:hypothetical protein
VVSERNRVTKMTLDLMLKKTGFCKVPTYAA